MSLSPLPLVLFLLGATADPVETVAGAGFDVERYRFEIRLGDDTDEVVATARIEGRFTETGRSALVLDLVGRTPAPGAADELGMVVDRVAGRVLVADGSGGRAIDVAFRQGSDLLVVRVPSPSIAGGRIAFDVEYRGVPADGLIISRNRHGERTFFGDNWPDRARHWLPTVDHPRDKAFVEFVVTAPDHYQVVANGELREETDLEAGLRRTHWASRAPLPTKVMVIGVARFAVEHLDPVAGVPLQSWVYRQDRDAGFAGYAIAARVLPVLVEMLGPFPYAKLANVQSTTRYGGMENAGAIFYGERSVGDGRGIEAPSIEAPSIEGPSVEGRNIEGPSIEGLIAHEIAHQWFGDAVTETDWAHAWISEGFATYLTQVYFERTVGEQRLIEGMAQARDRVLRFGREHPERTVVEARPAREMLDANTYQKGAWVLHMLRAELGDGRFFDGLRRVVERYRHANASSDDVRASFEESAGLPPGALRGFFTQWLERPGHPRLAIGWRRDPPAGEVEVTVRQVQAAAPFEATLEIGIVGEDGAMTVHALRIAGRETVVRLPARFSTSAIVVDPGVRLLMELEAIAELAAG
jgi:aminopeptidase N